MLVTCLLLKFKWEQLLETLHYPKCEVARPHTHMYDAARPSLGSSYLSTTQPRQGNML